MFRNEMIGVGALIAGSLAVLAWVGVRSSASEPPMAVGAAGAHTHHFSHRRKRMEDRRPGDPGLWMGELHKEGSGVEGNEPHDHLEWPAAADGDNDSGISTAERDLYQTPKGLYTAADIRANGALPPSQKFRGVLASHNMHPVAGDRLCPITRTRANPRFAWVIGGRTYLFCCPPCIDEFIKQARERPHSILPPDAYVKH